MSHIDLLARYNLTPVKVLKYGIFAIVAAFVILLGLNIVAKVFAPYGSGFGGMDGVSGTKMGFTTQMGGGAYDYDYAVSESAGYGGAPSLSTRNITMPSMPPYPYPGGYSSGNDAEEFEVTDYSVSIETRKRDETCASFTELKAKEYVIFESSNEYKRGCSYSFKVEHERVSEVLTWLEDLRPEEVNENSYTIKSQIEDFTSETEILQKKRAAIDDTLRSATLAYDEITRLATQNRDAESLAQIIDSKLQLIERLTIERINVSEQLDRLARAKAEQLDRLDYTYFSVSVIENKYVDTKALGESWKQSVRDMVAIVNSSVQGVTINLLAVIFLVFQYALYALILLIVVKYGWRLARSIWEK